MATYQFLKTIQYTEVVTVEADSESEGKELALSTDGERNHDDTTVDITRVRSS